MRTSRVSKEAAKIAALTSPKRQTRSQLASTASTATYKSREPLRKVARSTRSSLKTNEDSPPSSPLSSADIEDALFTPQSTRKRKRGADTPSTMITSASASTGTRVPPRRTKTQVKEEVDLELDSHLSERTRLPKARPQPSKHTTDPATGEVTIHPPENWEKIYNIVKAQRLRNPTAPVDTMGCERAADLKLSLRDQRFQTLIALMISSQTKDTTNAQVMAKLRAELPAPGLTLENILAIQPERLNELIYAVGFHNNKTRYIKQTAELLRDKWNGDIPDTAEGLMSLPGVGPKMAYLCLSAAWDKTEGIGVDVHVHRITNLWGWHKTRQPEETRKELQGWLPREKWREINWLLVGHGQTVCAPVGRKCGDCDLSGKGLCVGEIVDRKVKVVRKKEENGEEKTIVKEEDITVVGDRQEIVVKEEPPEGAVVKVR